MSLFVNTNINSLIAQRSLNSANSSLQSAITRLSTGYRVNQAGDDAAGLCVAQGLDTQIRGNKRAMLNVEDGLNMMYIAEGGMSGVTEDLQRIRELCIQAANGIYSPDQQQTLMNEINWLTAQCKQLVNQSYCNQVQDLMLLTTQSIFQAH
jgi:flagellin